MSADFAGLAAALLQRAETLIPEWLPGGRKSGAEYVCGDLSGGRGRSTSVNLKTGAWGDFSGEQRGLDLISLHAARRSLTQLEAARELAREIGYDLERTGMNGHGNANVVPGPVLSGAPPIASAPPEDCAAELSAEPAPTTAALPEPAGMLGRWAYYRAAEQGPILVVCRLPPIDGKKQFRQYTWRAGRWTPRGLPAPRPLYRLPVLQAHPDMPVVLCEGEKACQAAQQALSDHIVSTWSQGSQSVGKTDFTPLTARTVILWPDADDTGRRAMAQIAQVLLPLGARVSVIDTADRAPGWDAADAEPGEIASIVAAAKPIDPPRKPERHGRANPLPATRGATVLPSGQPIDSSAFVEWQSLGLDCNGNGQPFATLGNAAIVLGTHPDLAGKIWLDTFRKRIYHSLQGVPRPWTDAEALRLTAWINQSMRLSKIGLQTVHHAAELVAANNPRNSVVDYLKSLTWDETPRLDHWLADYLGVARTPFTTAVARNWLISMVARAFRPGCQADHMPVLEGLSGAGKSSTLAILGGEWYRAAPQAFGSKEFVEVIQGSWLIEIPDMVGFGRREHTQIISAITTRSDSYRASYGRIAEDHPRTCIFAATSETDEYLTDSRGKRRYWPLQCTAIDLDALEQARDQLFAESLCEFEHGANWHEVPAEEASEIQSSREETDIWMHKIAQFVAGRTSVSVSEVATDALEVDYARQDRSTQMRIAKCLKACGFSVRVERVGTQIMRVYRR